MLCCAMHAAPGRAFTLGNKQRELTNLLSADLGPVFLARSSDAGCVHFRQDLPAYSQLPSPQHSHPSLPRAKIVRHSWCYRRPGNMPTKLIFQSFAVILLFALTRHAVQGKVLGVFGDSVSDNGIGCNNLVKSGFANLGYDRTLLPDFPPAPAYWKGRFSNGPVWPEYLVKMLTGYELHDVAVGGASTVHSTFNVSAYYPDNLKNNGLGIATFARPGLSDQIETLLGQTGGRLASDDVMLVALGNNNFGDAQNPQSIIDFAFNATLDVYTNDTLEIYQTTLGQGLEQLYAAGARKVMVVSVAALDLVPQTINAAQQMAALNKAYTGIASTPVIEYFVALTTAAVVAAQTEAINLVARHAADPPNVQFLSLAELQRGFIANATQLGFIDTTNPCTLDALNAAYATSNEYELGTLIRTHPGAEASLAYDVGVGGIANATKYVYDALIAPLMRSKPNDAASFLAALSSQIKSIGQDATADRVKQLMGVMYTDLPMSLGGMNPWTFVPTCLTRAADHLFHDEVHPTTKQHKLIAQAVFDSFNGVLF